MRRAITLFVVAFVVSATSAQEKAPGPNSIADFLERPVGDSIAALKNKSKEIRQNAAAALFWRKSIPDRIIPDIVAGLRDDDPFVRKQLLDALLLKAINARAVVARAAVPTLRTMLKDRSLFIRMEAAKAMRRIAASEPVAAVFIEALESPDLTIRSEAARGLGQITSRPKEAVEPLRKCLEDEQPMVQLHAARALWLINRDPSVPPLLFTMAKSTEEYNRIQALEHLGLPGMDSAKVLPILREALKDESWLARWSAARSLAKVDAKIEERLPLLVVALQDSHRNVRAEAAQALQTIGPAAKSAVPQMIAALRKEDDWKGKSDMMDALGAIGEDAATGTPVVVEMLQSKESDGRDAALRTLLRIGPSARAALPAIRRVLDEGKGQTRIVAAAAAWRLGDDAKGRDFVREALRCKDAELRTGAAHLLGQVGTPAKAMLLELRSLLRDPDGKTRLAAAYSLWQLTGDESMISVLIDLLSDQQDDVRCESATRLGRIGSKAKKAIPALKRAVLDDDDEYVQQFAAEALEKIISDKLKP